MPLIFHSKPLNSASFRKKTLRPFLRCVCASQKSFFRRQTFASQHKSGGRKPPVVSGKRLAHGYRSSAKSGARETRSGWRKPAVVLETRSQRLDRNCRAEATGRWSVHGHRCNCVTIPRRADTRRSWSPVRTSPNSAGFSPHNVRITRHGGLTPAALVHVRLCIAKIVFSPADIRIAAQERGA
jgi:hypothetical protein